MSNDTPDPIRKLAEVIAAVLNINDEPQIAVIENALRAGEVTVGVEAVCDITENDEEHFYSCHKHQCSFYNKAGQPLVCPDTRATGSDESDSEFGVNGIHHRPPAPTGSAERHHFVTGLTEVKPQSDAPAETVEAGDLALDIRAIIGFPPTISRWDIERFVVIGRALGFTIPLPAEIVAGVGSPTAKQFYDGCQVGSPSTTTEAGE